MGYCSDCKHWTWNAETEEYQCWRDDSNSSGVPTGYLQSCQAIIKGGMGFEEKPLH